MVLRQSQCHQVEVASFPTVLNLARLANTPLDLSAVPLMLIERCSGGQLFWRLTLGEVGETRYGLVGKSALQGKLGNKNRRTEPAVGCN